MKKVLCLEDVIMKDTFEKSFLQGNVYRVRKYNYIENYDEVHHTLVATDEQKERHIILDLDGPRLDDFFQRHFKIID